MVEQKTDSSQTFFYIGIAAVVGVILLALWFLLADDDKTETVILPPTVTQTTTLAEPEAAVEPALEVTPDEVVIVPDEPTPAIPEAEAEPEPEPALPALDNADNEVRQRLLALDWRPGLAGLFVTTDMLRNFTVQVDNIAQGQLAAGHALLQPMEQKFSAADPANMQLDASSFARFDPYVQLLESVPPDQMIALFNRYEPLLQQAYAELGYPDDLFKNKLIAAIDVLLATPEVSYPLALQRPAVVYQFADPQLEQLPAAHKQMIRMGPQNQQRIKALLQRYKQQLQK